MPSSWENVMGVNPFKPTAGKNPPIFIGRDEVIEEFAEGLENGPGASGTSHAGFRHAWNGQDRSS